MPLTRRGPGPADRFLSLPLGLCDPGLGGAYRGVGLGPLEAAPEQAVPLQNSAQGL